MPHLTLKPRISQQQRGLLQYQDAHLRRAGQRVLPFALHLFCLLHGTVASCPPTILDKALTLGLYISPSVIQQKEEPTELMIEPESLSLPHDPLHI